MRTRLLVVAAVVVAVLGAAAVVVLVAGSDDEGLADEDRAALARAVDNGSAAAVGELAADERSWARLVAGGGRDLAALLDRSQADLGPDEDRTDRVAAVVTPWLDGRAVDDEVLPALGRWAWPILAADLTEEDARALASAVLARADEGDDERRAVTGGVALARIHRVITSPADADAVKTWRSDLARAAVAGAGEDVEDRTSALVDGDLLDLPAPLARSVLSSWGTAIATTDARATLAAGTATEPMPYGSVRTVAAYLAVIDDSADTDAARVVAGLALEAEDLVDLEDDLLSSDDPALAPTASQATLLLDA